MFPKGPNLSSRMRNAIFVKFDLEYVRIMNKIGPMTQKDHLLYNIFKFPLNSTFFPLYRKYEYNMRKHANFLYEFIFLI